MIFSEEFLTKDCTNFERNPAYRLCDSTIPPQKLPNFKHTNNPFLKYFKIIFHTGMTFSPFIAEHGQA